MYVIGQRPLLYFIQLYSNHIYCVLFDQIQFDSVLLNSNNLTSTVFYYLIFHLSDLSSGSPLRGPCVVLTLGPAAPEDDGLDGDALRGLPLGVDDGTLVGRGAEAGVWVSTGLPWRRKKIENK